MKTSQKALDKRKQERECLKGFFDEHLPKIKVCENCGRPIHSPGHKNVAHILPKETFKSIMCEPHNYMYLCTDLDINEGKGCHEQYDHTWSSAIVMNIWSTALKRFKEFEDKIKEKSIILLHFKN